MKVDLGQILALLQRLDTQQNEIKAQLDTLLGQRGSRCSAADTARLSKILPVVGATFGSALLTTSEVFASPSPGLRFVLEGVTRRQLGKLLARNAGRPVAGYVVSRIATESSAAVWRLEKVVSGVSNPVETPRPYRNLRRVSVG